jgi:hypothetical protein
MGTVLDQAGGSCDTSRQGTGSIGDQADTDEFNRGSMLEVDNVATLNTIQAVENTVRAADNVIAAAANVFDCTRHATSPAVESPALQATAPDIGTVEASMDVIKSSGPADESQAAGLSQSEGQFREPIRTELAPAQKPQAEADSETGAGSVNALLQRVAGTTFKEIDRLIEELHDMRGALQSEGQRVQRELVKYAQLTQTAKKSTKIIAEGLSQLQDSAERTKYNSV